MFDLLSYNGVGFDNPELKQILKALWAYEELALEHGACQIHDAFYMTVEQSEKIMEEYNSTYPQYSKILSENLVRKYGNQEPHRRENV